MSKLKLSDKLQRLHKMEVANALQDRHNTEDNSLFNSDKNNNAAKAARTKPMHSKYMKKMTKGAKPEPYSKVSRQLNPNSVNCTELGHYSNIQTQPFNNIYKKKIEELK